MWVQRFNVVIKHTYCAMNGFLYFGEMLVTFEETGSWQFELHGGWLKTSSYIFAYWPLWSILKVSEHCTWRGFGVWKHLSGYSLYWFNLEIRTLSHLMDTLFTSFRSRYLLDEFTTQKLLKNIYIKIYTIFYKYERDLNTTVTTVNHCQ